MYRQFTTKFQFVFDVKAKIELCFFTLPSTNAFHKMIDITFVLNHIRIQFRKANCIKMVTNGNKNEFVPYTDHNGSYLAC